MNKGAFVSFAILVLAYAPAHGSEKMQHSHDAPNPMHKGHGEAGHGAPRTGHVMPTHMGGVPHDLDTSTQKFSMRGMYSVDITSRLDPIKINKLHNWVLRIRTKDGKPVDDAKIIIGGNMPQHTHGFPTAPRVTNALGEGKYLVEGIRFNMTGWWQIKFEINGGHHKDHVTFNLILK